MVLFSSMASLNEDDIYAILSKVGDEEEVVPPNDLDSEVEDILETDSEEPTDPSSDSDDEPLRASNISRRRRINSNDSSDNARPTKQMKDVPYKHKCRTLSIFLCEATFRNYSRQ
ncbi:unnamed protein product [Parnassius apollo]|uniref:(apollo) hypothetical protein n=1 Tax=Parnassius apollo TaxID=110799 RepID=A0A8S3X324_PARAO|nr:unnamed protein product [Parnassius apollo]